MSDFDIVNTVLWHDGVLLEVKTTFKETHFNITLFIDIYHNETVGDREKMMIEFTDIDNLVFTIDAVELLDNRRSGNISNGYVTKIKNKKRYKFFLYLSDGLLSMTFKQVQLIKSLE